MNLPQLFRKKTVGALNSTDSRGNWYRILESFSGAWQRNVVVDFENVITFHAVYACVTLISADIGKLRTKLMERDGKGIWRETFGTGGIYNLLNRPNRYQNQQQFKENWIISKVTRGNTYCFKQRDEQGNIEALYVLDPFRVTPLIAPDGSIYYRLNDDNLSGLQTGGITVPASEIIHDRMNCLFHPLVGIAPIYASGLAAVQGLNIQNNSTKFFENMSQPGGILTVPGSISAEAAAELKKHWETNYNSKGLGKTAVLADGLKYEPMSVTPTDAQLIEQLRWTAEVVCSTFHVPAFKVGVGVTPTYQNAEMLNQIYYDDCLQSLIESHEACMNDGLELGQGTKNPKKGIQLDLKALLRMDSATHVKTLGEAVNKGIMAPNEARLEMNMEPKIGGDTPYLQQQNYSLSALDKRDKDAQKEGSKDVQAAAMNGAQITSLQGILMAVAIGQIPPESAKPLIIAGFPSIPESQVDAMLDPFKTFEATPIAALAAPVVELVDEGLDDESAAKNFMEVVLKGLSFENA